MESRGGGGHVRGGASLAHTGSHTDTFAHALMCPPPHTHTLFGPAVVAAAVPPQLVGDATMTASMVNALRRLAIEPPPGWVRALLEASRSALKNRCSDLHVAGLAGALAAWGVAPEGRWVARLMWRGQVLLQQGRMSPGALVALLQVRRAGGLQRGWGIGAGAGVVAGMVVVGSQQGQVGCPPRRPPAVLQEQRT